jgi:tRNA nucleotidyltransferase (CCA-adding enzyme)
LSAIDDVLERARGLVAPTAAQASHVAALAGSMLLETKKAAEGHPQTRGVILGGSFAKGTWLAGQVDLDIFVMFDPSTPEEDFERAGLEIGREATRGHPMGKKYAQHPYTEAIVGGTRVNIVPCFAVKKGEWKSAADRSPFHVELVEGISGEQKDEIRLLKRFMGGVGVYGAEIRRQGFSGYVAEVLVIQEGSFLKTLEYFDRHVPSPGKAFTLPDPVDPGRDLGIAVSGESVGRMVLASREFLRRPRLAFFRGMEGRARPRARAQVVAIVFSHAMMSEDTLWGELRKTTRHIVRHLEEAGFRIARSMAASDDEKRSAILLLPEFTILPVTEQRVGPTVDRKKDVESFLKSNSRASKLVWVDDDARVRLLMPRRYTEVTRLVTDIARGRSGHIGASRELEAGMKKSARVLVGPALSREAKSAKWLDVGLREITTDAIGTR